jgi:uncharacterized protein
VIKYKHLPTVLLVVFSLVLSAQRFPDPPDPPQLVNDFADALSQSQENQLESKLVAYSDTTSTEIAVVLINTLNDEDPNLYAAELGEAWGVGRKGKDNGLVFLVAVDDRQMAIQNGYGLEAVLTDYETKMIIENYIIPEFKQGDYYGGIDSGTDQIILLLAGEFDGSGNRRGEDARKGIPVFAIIIILIILFSIFRRRGRGGGLRGGGGYWIGGMGGFGSSGGFGGGSSFGGGGFGGFGGGSFGGGGASGSW